MKWRLAVIGIIVLIGLVVWVALRLNAGITTADGLSRLVVNALVINNGREQCEPNDMQSNCSVTARLRRATGFLPPVESPVIVGNARSLFLALESIQLLPVTPRGNDSKPEDSLLVRVSNHKMWLDFAGKSRAGNELKVSIELDVAGGTPVKLIANIGNDTKEVTLRGTAEVANDRKLKYIVPEADVSNPKFANWVYLPNEGRPKTFTMLAITIQHADPEFIPQIAQVVFTSLGTASPEESIGLYPALRIIDRNADGLRAINAHQWLSQEQTVAMVNAAYADAPAARAAWILSMCESTSVQPSIDDNCWYRMTSEDTAVNALLRREINQLQSLYETLEQGHPLRLRLNRLDAALTNTALRKAALIETPITGS